LGDRGFLFGGDIVPNAAKAETIAETRALLEGSAAVVLASYQKLSVSQVGQLRDRLAERGVRARVVKNTLIKRAADEVGITGLEPFLKGPTMLLVSDSDPVAPAQGAQAAQREFRTLEMKAGILGRATLDTAAVRQLAALPGREALLGQLVGTLAAPVQRLVWVLDAPIAQLARVLEQVRQTRESGETA